jgi:2,6-dihydroxypseudooxynicotine hydrolase
MEPVIQATEKEWYPSRFLAHRFRFLANGVDIHDLETTLSRVQEWDNWCRAWCETGRAHEERAERALSEGRSFTSAQYYLRAASCYHFAQNLFYEDLEQKSRAQHLKVAAFKKGAPALSPAPESVEIPFDRITMAANLRIPLGSGRVPGVILIPGSDASKEEFYPREQYYLDRGLATLSLDGPGQGETWFKMRMRLDYEKAISAAIDYLQSRPEIDGSRIGLWGGSFAGYLVVRAAAFDKRIRACVENCGPFEVSYYRWDDLLRLRRFNYLWGTSDANEADKVARQVTLAGVIEKVECPLLVMHGKTDVVTPYEEAVKIYEAARCPKELLLFDDGNHVCHNLHHIIRPITADWMRQKLTSI